MYFSFGEISCVCHLESLNFACVFLVLSSSLLFLGLRASNFLFAFLADLDVGREPCGWEMEQYATRSQCDGNRMIRWDVFWGCFFPGNARESVAVADQRVDRGLGHM